MKEYKAHLKVDQNISPNVPFITFTDIFCLSLRSSLQILGTFSSAVPPKVSSSIYRELSNRLAKLFFPVRILLVNGFVDISDSHKIFDVLPAKVFLPSLILSFAMANWRQKVWRNLSLLQEASYSSMPSRLNKSKIQDLSKIRPMILKRIEARAKEYPLKDMIPVAKEVLKARQDLVRNVTALLKVFPVLTCKFCPEVFVGNEGHLIQTCRSYMKRGYNRLHEWIPGSINDVLAPVEAFHIHNMSKGVIKHEERFNYDRVPAILELCCQAGAILPQDILHYSQTFNSPQISDEGINNIPTGDLKYVAADALRAWDNVRACLNKLLLVYPSKVCKHCSEVHIGPSGHKARLCGVFKYESWRGTHYWEKASVKNLVPEKVVWHRRPQDPMVLLDEGRNYYGHAPAIVSLCTHAGAITPARYLCKMKPQGLPFPFINSTLKHNTESILGLRPVS